ncbi:MAG: hypothetical protein PVF65_06275 [Sphingomonadales bacterium]|jgi:hypothetical protein
MVYLIAGIVLLLLVYYFLDWLKSADPSDVRRSLTSMGIVALVLIALILVFTGRVVAAWPFLLGAFGLYMRLKQAWGLASFFKQGLGHSSQKDRVSVVRSSHIKMTLNHENAQLNGKVLKGLFAGKKLSDMDQVQLLNKHEELMHEDQDGLRLLENYLDKAFPNWRMSYRQNEQRNEANGPDKMDEAQALDILGLKAGAKKDEVRAAHKRLMKQLHPDSGGSTYLASKINEARDFLLSKLG